MDKRKSITNYCILTFSNYFLRITQGRCYGFYLFISFTPELGNEARTSAYPVRKNVI